MKTLNRIVAIVVLSLAAHGTAVAADGSWNVDALGNWTTGTNWLGSTIPGTAGGTTSTDIATFGFTLTGARTVTVDANRNVGGITFSNTSAFGYTLQTGALRLSNGGVIQTAAGNGVHTDTISSAIAIQGNGGSATFTAGATNASSLLRVTGAVTGVSTAGNTTTLTLNGDSIGANGVSSIGDGSSGGKLAVVKSGNGTWQFLGGMTFTGGLTLSGGRLATNANNRLGNGTVTFNGGALGSTDANVKSATNAILFTGNGTMDLFTLSGPVDLGNATRIVSSTSSATISGVISNGGLTKVGSGTLTLGGNNTYAGATTVSSSTLTVGDGATAGSIASSASIAIDSGATLNFNRTDSYGGNYSNPISGAGTLQVAAGTLSLTGNNASFSGPMSIAGGTLSIGSSNSLGTGTVSFTANNAGFSASSDVSVSNSFRATTASGGGNFFFTGTNNISAGQLVFAASPAGGLNNTMAADRVLTFSSLTNNGANQTARINGSGNTTFTNGVLNNGAGATTLTIDSTGTTTIGGTSTFTGALTQNAGRLVINGPLLGTTGTYPGAITANGAFDLLSSGTTVLSGAVGGSGIFTVNGGGSLVVRSSAVTWTGTLAILSGKYTYNQQVGAGTGTIVLGDGSLANGATTQTLRNPALVFAGNPTFGDATATAQISFLDNSGNNFSGWTADLGGATRTLTVLATSATIPHVVSNGGLTKEGTGLLALTATNTFSGTTRVNGGTLSLNGNSRGLQNSMVDLGGSGTLANYSTTPVFGGITNYGSFSFPGTVTRLTLNVLSGGTQTYSTLPGGGAANIGFGKEGGGTLVFGGTFNYTGATNVDDGVLEVASLSAAGQPGSLGAGTTINLGAGVTSGTFRYVGTSSATTDRTFNLAGTTGGGVIDASGGGALVLTGTSTATGSGTKTLTITGTSTATNTLGMINDPASSNVTSVVKDGSGLWRLAAANDFSGSFTVKNGTLVAANSGAFGDTGLPIVGDTANGATGTAALLAEAGVSIYSVTVTAAGAGSTQTVLLGGASSNGTAFYAGNVFLDLGRNVSLVATTGGTTNFASNWRAGSGTGIPTVDVAIGAAGYAGTVKLAPPTTSGTLATTGAVSVRYGTAVLGESMTLDGAGTLAIDSGATLAGIGTVAGPLGGAGLVAPGNSPGILTAEAFDATGGLGAAFEFSGTAPNYASASSSLNDVLRLTGTSPFLASTLGTSNVVNVYLPSSVAAGDVFLGGFFVDSGSDFTSLIQGATYNYWVAGSGTHVYNSGTYAPLGLAVTVGTTPQTSGTFGNGDQVNGTVSTFTVAVPEPATVALAAIGVAMAGYAARRRRRPL
jgi:autotransporter-associated beta strand protein